MADRVARRERLEPGRRAVTQALADIEMRYGLSAVDMIEVLAGYQQTLIGFVQEHPVVARRRRSR